MIIESPKQGRQDAARGGGGARRVVLEAKDVHISIETTNALVRILRGVTLDVGAGEAVGLVGESGSGKSTFARAALGLLPRRSTRVESGQILIEGSDVTRFSELQWEQVRGNPVALVFQDPLSYLNPLLRLGFQIGEAIRRHDPQAQTGARIRELLQLVQLPASAEHAYPHELSGGMRQRGLLAVALACRPKLLVADEPTTALDVTTQAEILALLRNLRRTLNMSLLLISHDLGVVSSMCERLYVMYAGRIMEQGPTETIFRTPSNPYTQGLVRSARLTREASGRFATIPGDVPSATEFESGCPFAPRCPKVFSRCSELPRLFPVDDGSASRCWLNAKGTP